LAILLFCPYAEAVISSYEQDCHVAVRGIYASDGIAVSSFAENKLPVLTVCLLSEIMI
jgi:hypothetical protein